MGPGVKKSGPQAVPGSIWTSRVALTSLRGQEVRGQRAKGVAEAWPWEGQSTRDGLGEECQLEQQLVRAWG